MFDSKKYHREYMRKYRENVINKSPEKLKRRRELAKKNYHKYRKNPEWVKKTKLSHKKYAKKYRSKPGMLEILATRRRKYYGTEKGERTIIRAKDRYQILHPDRVKAWWLSSYARSIGKIQKKPCRVCGSKNVHAHHPDISKPLKVVFLCPLHHRREEIKLKHFKERIVLE